MSAANIAIRAAAAYAAASEPRPTAIAKASSTAISAAQPIGRSGAVAETEARQRSDARARRGQLRECGTREQDSKDDPQNDLHQSLRAGT